MPFRAKMRKAFGRTGSGSNSPSEGSTTPNGHPIEYYKPGEIPRSKYRGPWNQEHQDKLQSFAFSFGRKTSDHGSDYSPAQTRAQSRRTSWVSAHRRPSAGGSVSGKSGKGSLRTHSRVGKVPEAEDDTDIANVGLSRPQTKDKRGPNLGNDGAEDDDDDDNELAQQKTVTLPQLSHEHDQPFSEDELTKALTDATLKQRPE